MPAPRRPRPHPRLCYERPPKPYLTFTLLYESVLNATTMPSHASDLDLERDRSDFDIDDIANAQSQEGLPLFRSVTMLDDGAEGGWSLSGCRLLVLGFG